MALMRNSHVFYFTLYLQYSTVFFSWNLYHSTFYILLLNYTLFWSNLNDFVLFVIRLTKYQCHILNFTFLHLPNLRHEKEKTKTALTKCKSGIL